MAGITAAGATAVGTTGAMAGTTAVGATGAGVMASCRSCSAARGATAGTTGATVGTTGDGGTDRVLFAHHWPPYCGHRRAAADRVLQHQLQLLLPARSQQQARAEAVDGDAPVQRA